MMSNFGICRLSAVPLRSEPSHVAELVSELLYNDTYEILEDQGEWLRIRTCYDHYEGYLRSLQHTAIDSLPDFKYITHHAVTSYHDKWLSLGSFVDEECEGCSAVGGGVSTFLASAQQFLGVPYRWGGRTCFGIDCSALVQVSAKVAGKVLPRDAYQQVDEGEIVYFLDEAQAGDIAFFHATDDPNKIVHVGILLNKNTILHASGLVRIDALDQTGIFNREINKHTHFLSVIKRIF